MTASIRPLSNSQKLFLQRLMVGHVLTDDQARDLYASIREKFANVEVEGEQESGVDPAFMGNSFDHCLGLINVSLKAAFNLEICTVYLPPPYDPDGAPATSSSSSSGRTKSPTLIKYHAVVNKSNDVHAKSYASPLSHSGPHEMAYLRLILQKLVDIGNDMDVSVGCRGVMNKMDIINSRTDLEGAHANKLSVAQTEAALELFLMEKWLVEMAPPGEEESDGEDESDEDRSKKRRKRLSSSGDRRKSLRGTYYGIGPRCFLEMGEFLQAVGLPEERIPQTIINLP
ncbi:hypothetical protein HJC23_004576 [Cyclotella cryptica]|uniref:Non-structural maintenance of chromosomes element 1 homolog n=1 Tax=Cyclotella cryptica TaxID=29204 RepID=A0ABD3QB73_9STRA|eukprot:CCRYP_007326-RA/>CCRYP_007326-RA protein AED:0.13 eAED:0.13 QI:214/-1/1/1/-1/1/1/596/284